MTSGPGIETRTNVEGEFSHHCASALHNIRDSLGELHKAQCGKTNLFELIENVFHISDKCVSFLQILRIKSWIVATVWANVWKPLIF